MCPVDISRYIVNRRTHIVRRYFNMNFNFQQALHHPNGHKNFLLFSGISADSYF